MVLQSWLLCLLLCATCCRCWPDGKVVWAKEDELGGYPLCSGPVGSVTEGRKSFPSGASQHSTAQHSTALHGMTIAQHGTQQKLGTVLHFKAQLG
jgi:hypothetical protein